MLFNSQVFIIGFLPAVLLSYYALAANRVARQAFLVLASWGFYGWWDVRFVPLLAGLTVANWLIAIWFGRERETWIPVLGVTLNLAVLGLFKYADFLRGTVFGLAGEPWQPWRLILPLGISFFVFQKISYLIDLRRGDRHIYEFLDFCLFVSFFPQLIAGPLVRHNEIIHQFRADPRGPAMWENLGRGFVLFVIGVTKKVALADSLAMVADSLFAKVVGTPLGLGEAWTAALAYTLQIYFDFSGYSDMAIGLALMFGLRLPFNFDAPYRAVSVREFWRRWHMTLSRFLRDYLYIPLGGNRSGAVRQAANVVLTMLLGGLWHGANWTFVVWGGLHGVALAVNHLWSRTGLRLPKPIAWALTMLFVMLAWVLFRAANFSTALAVLRGMLGLHGFAMPALTNESEAAIAIGCAVALVGPVSQRFALTLLRPVPWLAVPTGILLSWLLLLIGGRLPNVFIYFQF
jgi:D-alanyl-lipoteichoic acid acyltransferase DltB (MBOAT superfamily)